jgi:hypothetical protein
VLLANPFRDTREGLFLTVRRRTAPAATRPRSSRASTARRARGSSSAARCA